MSCLWKALDWVEFTFFFFNLLLYFLGIMLGIWVLYRAEHISN